MKSILLGRRGLSLDLKFCIEKGAFRTSCSSSSSRSSLGSFFKIRAVHEREGGLSQDRAEHAELADDIDRESKCRSRRSLSRPLWLWLPGLNFISSRQRVSLLSVDVVTCNFNKRTSFLQTSPFPVLSIKLNYNLLMQDLGRRELNWLTSILIVGSNGPFEVPVDAVHDIGGALNKFQGAVSSSVGNFLYVCNFGSSFRYLSIS